MVHAWIIGSIVAVIAGLVGFFVVLRGAAFAAHAVPNGAFAGAAAASLLGVDVLLGLGVFAVAAAIGIAALGRRGRQDVATALALVVMLAVGALLLGRTADTEAQLYSLLFGELLGVSGSALLPVVGLALACVVTLAVVFRPLLLTSAAPALAEAHGLSPARTDAVFLVVLALATAMTVPVVGALLVFSLMIGPPAAARSFTSRPALAIGISVVTALSTVWSAIALSYATDWPVGFFVGMLGACWYAAGRLWRRRELRPAVLLPG